MSQLTKLHTLQLADNFIFKIEGLKDCVALDSLYLKSNKIGSNGMGDFVGLLECPTLACIDLQSNRVDNPEILEEVLVKMPNLKVLYM